MRQNFAATGKLVGMARVEVYPDRVVIQLTATEKVLAMHRRDVVIDRDAGEGNDEQQLNGCDGGAGGEGP